MINVFLCVVSAILLSAGFLHSNFSSFSWFAFLPLFFALKGKSPIKSFFLSYIAGIIFWFVVIYWLIHVTLIGLILLVLYLALYFAVFGVVFSIINRRPSVLDILSIPSLWIILEYLRGYLLTGFPWATLGYSQYQNLVLIQIADIGGVYGVSFLIVMVNVGIYSFLMRKLDSAYKKKCTLVIFCLFVVLGYGFYRLNLFANSKNDDRLNVCVIQANIPQHLKWNPKLKDKVFNEYSRLTKKALRDKPDFIIWPETAIQDYLTLDKGEYVRIKKLESFIKGVNVPVLLGMVTVEQNRFFNSAVLFSKDGEVTNRYDKLHLVPFGEYIPLREELKFLEKLVPIDDFTPGDDYTVFSLGENKKAHFSTLICFEDLFPDLAREFVKKGARFLVNITNDAWFMDTVEPYQHLAASVFRAVENRVSLVRSANTGVSSFIMPWGKIKSRVIDKNLKDTFVQGYKTETIPLNRTVSFYNRYGDIFVLLCFIIFGFSVIIRLLRKIGYKR